MTDAQGTRGNEATPQPGQTEPLYSDNRIKLALRQLPTRDDVKQMAYFVAAEMRDNYERDKAFWAQALAAQAAEHAAALARIAELEAQLVERSEWTPVNPVGMVNDEYADAEIMLCYRRVQREDDNG